MYWMFGFKYWVISIEVPRLIAASKEGAEDNQKSICSEARYEALNWVGILINMGICLAVGWKRGMMEYDSAFGQASDKLVVLLLCLYVTNTGLMFISALFLADALRRLNKSFSKDSRLVVN